MSAVAIAVDEGLWTVRDVASYLKVSRSWVYQHADELGAVHIGACVRFLPAVIRAFAAAGARARGTLLNVNAKGI